MEYLIAFGANLGDREGAFRSSQLLISERIGPILRASKLIETAPLLNPENPIAEQPNYLNGVWLVESHIDPRAVLLELLAIEMSLGRIRSTLRWEPRVVDLDLLAAEHLVIESEDLKLPHPEMHKRLFVLEPLCEIAPDWTHPIFKQTATQLLREAQQIEKPSEKQSSQ